MLKIHVILNKLHKIFVEEFVSGRKKNNWNPI